MKKFVHVVLMFGLSFSLLVGCSKMTGGDVELVKNGYFGTEKSMTVGQIFDKYKYFKSTNWKASKTDRGQRIVEFSGEYDYDKDDEIKKLVSQVNAINKADNQKLVSGSTITIQFKINEDSTFQISGGLVTRKYADGSSDVARDATEDDIRYIINNETTAL